MNITFPRKEAFMLLLSILNINIFSQSFTEVNSFATGTNYVWKTSYTYWIDVDNDNDLDILNIEAESGGISKLFINDNPGFHEGLPLPFSQGDKASAGDFDRDGFVDFVMLGSPVRIYRNNHNQTFSAMPDNTVPSTILIMGESIDCGDYDNDGDQDILHNNKVFRNNGNNTFSLVESIVITEMMEGSSEWGDYDNDGDIDILITGSTPDGYKTKIYNNSGNSIFNEVPELSLTAGTQGVTEWGDYDNDGDLDFIISGYNGYPYYFTVLYKNNGLNNFTQVTDLPFSGLSRGSARWGDFDNDGDLDILFAGLSSPAGGSEITRIYRNIGNDSFELYSDYSFPGIGRGTAAWGDYNNDGALDISIIGNSSTGIIAKLFRNELNPTNKVPSAPQNPSSSVKNQEVTLKWDPVNDGDTPEKAITYNVRIGTATGQNNLLPSHSSSDGYRKIAAFGNVSQDASLILKKVPFGTYWWGVQAIDNNLEGGAFSAEGSFLVQPVQAGDLSSRILNTNSLTIKWERGTGDRCIVFGKQAATGIAEPVDGTGYIADSEMGYGSQIGTTGWYCLYNGRADSVIVTGLLSNTLYSFHIFEYSGSFGSEDYMTNLNGNGNPGVFSTNNFPHQTNIVFGVGDYHNKALWNDYDKDGYQDILVVGNPTKLYRNGGNNTFVVIPAAEFSFPAIESGSAAWGDFDNDKDLDLLLTGNPASPIAKIYRNKGVLGFEDIFGLSTPITPVSFSAIDLGDYDNDGDLDILMTGATGADPNYNPVSKVYRNNGSDQFAEQTGIILTGLFKGSAKWGDYDNDGDLDILLTGTTSTGLFKTEIYKNNGGGNFSLVSITIPGFNLSTASFGDYDNDGDLDIIIGSYPANLRIYENKGNDIFQLHLNIEPPFGTMDSPSTGEWADFNNDGFLDFIYTNPPLWFTRIYLNTRGVTIPGAVSQWFYLYDGTLKKSGNGAVSLSDYDNDGDIDILLSKWDAPSVIRNSFIMKSGSYLPNSAPTAPSGLSSTLTPAGVWLKWKPVKNDETGYKPMTYNVRIGTAPNTWNFCPSNSDVATGTRMINEMGNAQTDTTFFLKNLPSGTYYWEVQAVDQAFKGGTWSATGTFEVKNVQAFFSATEVCLGLPTQFTDESVATKGIASWLWDFGDGATSTSQHPQHTYASSGTFSVKLTINDTESSTDFLIKSANVKAKPSVNFTATTVCQGLSTSISNTTNLNGLTISLWSWNFGDGHTSSLQNPGSNTYSFAGDYTVSLGAEATNGCIGEITKTVSVVGYPAAAVSADGATTFCSGESITLSTLLNPDYTYVWNRDGAPITGAISNTYTAQISGTYTTAVTNKGLCTTTSPTPVSVVVNSSPAAPLISAAGPITFCQGDHVDLSVTYTDGYSYQWKLNGGAVGTSSNTYTATASGTYSLEVANASGCKTNSTNTVNVTVNPNPSVPAVNISGPTTFCQGNNVELSVANTGGYTYQWENNSAAITGANTSTYIANNSGVYTLKITNTNNCFIRTENVAVNVSAAPLAPTISATGALTFCQGDATILSVTNTAGYSYQWKLNGGAVGSNSNVYSANASGTYNLVVTNSSNCSVSSTNSVAITVNPNPAIPTVNISGPTAFCQGGNVELSVTSTPGYEYQWENNGSGITGAVFNSYVAQNSGNYILKISNSYGCSTKTESVAVTVATTPSAPLITAAGALTFCQGDSVDLSVTPGSDLTYQWTLNGGTIGTNTSAIKAKNAGTYSLTVSNSIGCSANSTNNIAVAVNARPSIPTVNLSGPTTFCQGNSVDLSVAATSGYNYQWENNGTAIAGAATNALPVNASGVYSLKITNADNCYIKTENVSVNVLTVPSAPTISAASATTFCQGDSVVLSVTNTPGYIYQWRLNGGSVGTNSNQLVAKTSGSYDIVVSNSSGCSVASLIPVPVVVNPMPALSIITVKGEEKFCSGERTNLSVPVIKDYLYSWKKGTSDLGLSTNSIDVTESGSYTVELDLAGCKLTAEPVTIEVVAKPARPDIDSGLYSPPMCLGENPLRLSVDNIVPGYTYQWYKNETPVSSETFVDVVEAGNYYLEAVVDICPSERSSLSVTFDQAPLKPVIIPKGPTVWYLSTTSKAASYKWYFNGTSIPDATGSSYMAGQNYGIYRLAVANETGCYSFSDTLRIPVFGTTGIEDLDPFADVKIYPNPTTGMFTIEMNNNVFGELMIDIITQNGSKILNIKFEKTSEHFSSQIDLSGQSKGMYLINLSIDKFKATRKILVE